MKKFNIRDIVEDPVDKFLKARADLDDADMHVRQNPMPRGAYAEEGYTKAYAAKAAQAACQNELRAAGNAMIETSNRLTMLKAEIMAAIDDLYGVNPALVDTKAMELLKSGVCKPSDYQRLMDQAKEHDNATMQRLISKYADDAAAQAESNHDERTAQACRVVAAQAQDIGQKEKAVVSDYADALIYACKRSPENPELCAEILPMADSLTEYLSKMDD